MNPSPNAPTPVEQALIAAAGLEATFTEYPTEVLGALRNATAMRARLARPQDAAEEPATTFRPPAP